MTARCPDVQAAAPSELTRRGTALLASCRGVKVLTPRDWRNINRGGAIDLRDARTLQRLTHKAPNDPLNP